MSFHTDILYKGGNILTYSASLASTWIWAPALFVSSSIGYFYGFAGLAAFLIPNILCLILFGFVAKYVIDNHLAETSFLQLTRRASERQKNLHFLIGGTLTTCSTIVQLLGMHILLTGWFDCSVFSSCVLISIISLVIVWKDGIKSSIITDYYKWIVIALSAIIILVSTMTTIPVDVDSLKVFDPKDIDYLISFGVVTAIGLLSSPYVDQTMWQRAFSCQSKNIIKTFLIAGLMFAIVPFCFGLTGIIYGTLPVDSAWSITNALGHDFLGIVLGVAMFLTLLSTIDSNICAVQSFVRTEFNREGKWAMVLFLIIATLLTCSINITLTGLFLVYGTIRTCGALPTLMITFNRFNERRLFAGTVAAIIFGAIGYIVLTYFGCSYAYLCSPIALLLPLIGYSNHKQPC